MQHASVPTRPCNAFRWAPNTRGDYSALIARLYPYISLCCPLLCLCRLIVAWLCQGRLPLVPWLRPGCPLILLLVGVFSLCCVLCVPSPLDILLRPLGEHCCLAFFCDSVGCPCRVLSHFFPWHCLRPCPVLSCPVTCPSPLLCVLKTKRKTPETNT